MKTQEAAATIGKSDTVPQHSKIPRLIAYMANAGNRNLNWNKVPKHQGSQTLTKDCENELKDRQEKLDGLSDFFIQLNKIQLDGRKRINALKEAIEDLPPFAAVLDLKTQILDVKCYDESVRQLLDNVQHFLEEDAKPQNGQELQCESLETLKNFELNNKPKIEYPSLPPPQLKCLIDNSSQTLPPPQCSDQSCQTDEPISETLLNLPGNDKIHPIVISPDPKNENKSLPERLDKFYEDAETQTYQPIVSININLPSSITRKARASLPSNFSNTIQSALPQIAKSNALCGSELRDLQIDLDLKTRETLNDREFDNTRLEKKTLKRTVSTQADFVNEGLMVKVRQEAYRYSQTMRKKFREYVSSYDEFVEQMIQRTEEQTWKVVNKLKQSHKELARRYKQEMSLRKKYHNELMQLRGNIRVFCRIRPPTATDEDPNSCCISVSANDRDIMFVKNKNKLTRFEMDRVFPQNSCQSEVFDEIRSLVTSCIDGFNVCILAYGQTGSGKTYTMEGTPNNPGMNQRALKDLFRETSLKDDWNYSISVSMLEIYNEQIRDLLNEDASNKLEMWNVEDVTIIPVYSVQEVNKVCASGHKNRAKAATNLNTASSRSHALLCVRIEGCNPITNTQTKGKLYLIDLAGSENVEKSGVDGPRLIEAGFINKSLSTFSDVINAILLKKTHIPYRNSKLTHLLQDSLGGNSKTLLITQVAPGDAYVSETLQTLQFAQRIRTIQCLSSNTKSRERLDSERSDSSSKNENSRSRDKTDDENSPEPISSIPPRFASMYLASPTKSPQKTIGSPKIQTKRRKSLNSK